MVLTHTFFFQAEDGIRDLVRSRGLGDVYKRQQLESALQIGCEAIDRIQQNDQNPLFIGGEMGIALSLIHI